MSDYLALGALGLALGALYAGIGMGVVATFRATGVINIGQVGLGMWGAYVAYALQTDGQLVLPWVVLPSRLDLGDPWPVWPAALLGVTSAAVLGAAAHLLVFRPLRHAPQMARTIATVGLLFLMQALVVQQFGSTNLLPAPLLPGGIWDVSVGIPVDRFILAGITLTLAVGLAVFQRRTLLGLALRAGAENETTAAIAGWSPTALGVVGWSGGAAVSAALVVLAAPSLGLSATTFPELLVPGLAVALVGRLSSVTVTATAGLVLGMFQSIVTLVTSKPWWPTWAIAGVGNAVPFVVIVVVLFVMGRRLPQRGETVTVRLPSVERGPFPWLLAALGVAAGVIGLASTSGVYRFGLVSSFIFAFMTLSLVVLTGLIGQVSLAQAAIAGVSAFALVRITPGVAFPVNVVIAALTATVAGVVMGLPALRIRHGQLAVVTLAAAVGVADVVFGNVVSSPTLPAPSLFGWDLGAQRGSDIARLPFGFLVLALLAVACLVVARLTRGRWGRRFLAVRGDERAAFAAGVDVGRTKLMGTALASFLAGIGGALLAYSQGQASAPAFAVMVGLSLVVYAYLGGITSSTGAVLAGLLAPSGLLYVVLNQHLTLGSWYALVSAIGLLVSLVLYPEGAVGAVQEARARVLDRLGRHDRVGRVGRSPDPESSRARAARAASPAGLPPAGEFASARIADRVGDPVVLSVTGVTVRYGGVTAVDDVSFDVQAGEVVGLIGPNGAGKTSLIDAITGFAPSTGDVFVTGRSVRSLKPAARYRAGLARTWQTPLLFEDLTVRENVAVAATPARPGDLLRDIGGVREAGELVERALVTAGASDLADRAPRQLSTGQQRAAALARAIVGRPSVLLADEPAAGLDPDERPQLSARLRALADEGTGVLLVEHDLELVLSVCDRVVVIDRGQVIASGRPAEIREDPVVIAAYLGTADPETTEVAP